MICHSYFNILMYFSFLTLSVDLTPLNLVFCSDSLPHCKNCQPFLLCFKKEVRSVVVPLSENFPLFSAPTGQSDKDRGSSERLSSVSGPAMIFPTNTNTQYGRLVFLAHRLELLGKSSDLENSVSESDFAHLGRFICVLHPTYR